LVQGRTAAHALHQVGVGEERAAKGDQISLSGGQSGLSSGVIKAAREDERPLLLERLKRCRLEGKTLHLLPFSACFGAQWRKNSSSVLATYWMQCDGPVWFARSGYA
jgi:hypothetical protein